MLFDPRFVKMAAIVTNAVVTKCVLIALGWWVGKKLDAQWSTTPYMMTAGICLGMGLGLAWIIYCAKRFKF